MAVTTTQIHASPLASIRAAFEKIWCAPGDNVKSRIELAQDRKRTRRLLNLSDELLDDIGLERSDVQAVLRADGPNLPSEELKRIRKTRQHIRMAKLRS